MSKPTEQSADKVFGQFSPALTLRRAHLGALDLLDTRIVEGAHWLAERALGGLIDLPPRELRQPLLFAERRAGNEQGGLQFNFSRREGKRYRTVGARVVVYKVLTEGNDEIIESVDGFVDSEADEVAQCVVELAQVCKDLELPVSQGLTSLKNLPPVPIIGRA